MEFVGALRSRRYGRVAHLVVPNMSVLHDLEVRLPPTLPEHLVVPNMSVLHDCPDGDVRVIGAGVFSGAELEVEAAEA